MTELHQRIRSICYSGNGHASSNLNTDPQYEYDTYRSSSNSLRLRCPLWNCLNSTNSCNSQTTHDELK